MRKTADLLWEYTDITAGKGMVVMVGASKPWSISSACKNLRGQQPPKDRNIVKIQFGWVNVCVYNVFVYGPKFTIFSSPNVGGVVVDQLLFSDFRQVDPFGRYSRSNSKVV